MKKPNTTATLFAVLVCLGILAVAACAPAASTVGLDIGQSSPQFAMTLSDGSQVTSDALVEEDQPAHLFWFATW